MNKLKFLACLMLIFGLGFGSQPDECLFKKQHLVVSLDWRYELLKPTLAASNKYYFFNRGISDFTLNDTTHMQGLQTDASKVTFGKIALESIGALGGGFLLAYPITKMSKYDVQVGYPIGFSIGPAIGATLVGNALMEPNGSFLKSIIGSALGTGLGYLVFLYFYIKGFPDPSTDYGDEYNWSIVVAAGLPVIGATAGYNIGIPEMNQNSGYFERNYRFFNETLQLNQTRLKLSLISIEF